MSQVQEVLIELERAKDREYGVFVQAQETLKKLSRYASTLSEDEFNASQDFEIAAFEITQLTSTTVRDSTKLISQLVATLDEDQLIDLVRSPDQEYTAYLQGDFSFIDTLHLKTEAFGFILSPSQKVVDAHNFHLKLIRSDQQI